MKDNRLNQLKGILSQPGEIDEAFREICSEFGFPLSEARQEHKAKTPTPITGLVNLCKVVDAKIIIDPALDFFIVEYADKGEIPVESPIVEENPKLEEEQEEEDYTEVGSSDIIPAEDDETELF